MEASIDSVANSADDGASQPQSAATSPDQEVQFRPQAASSAACGWQPMTGADIGDFQTTSGTVPRASADQHRRPAYATAMSGNAMPTPRDADPWSVASALMLLHNYNDQHPPTNDIIARPTTGDAALEGA